MKELEDSRIKHIRVLITLSILGLLLFVFAPDYRFTLLTVAILIYVELSFYEFKTILIDFYKK